MQRGQRDGLTAGKAAAAAALAGALVTGAGGIAVDAVDAEVGVWRIFVLFRDIVSSSRKIDSRISLMVKGWSSVSTVERVVTRESNSGHRWPRI